MLTGVVITDAGSCRDPEHSDYAEAFTGQDKDALVAKVADELGQFDQCCECAYQFFLLGEDLTEAFLAARAAVIEARQAQRAARRKQEAVEDMKQALPQLRSELADLESGAKMNRVRERIKELEKAVGEAEGA